MRVLHLTDRLSDRGGAHRHLRAVLEAQAARLDLHLAHGADDGGGPAPCPATLVPGLEARAAAPAGLEALARRLSPDLVHVHTVVNPDVLAWAAARPSVITVQDHRYFCPARGKWKADGRACAEPMRPAACAGCFQDRSYFEEVFALTASRLAAVARMQVVVLSAYMRDELRAAGVAAGRLHVVPPFVHGLDPEARADGPPCVLFVGRLVEAKGVWDAVESWRRSGVRLPLVFAGTGPLRAALEERGFEVLGWRERPALGAAYRRARALLFPPRWQEPFGIAGLEARTMGVPVAAWDSGGVREWHGPRDLVAWGDLEGLARRLAAAVEERAPAPPAGFAREPLMARLDGVYRGAAAGPDGRA